MSQPVKRVRRATAIGSRSPLLAHCWAAYRRSTALVLCVSGVDSIPSYRNSSSQFLPSRRGKAGVRRAGDGRRSGTVSTQNMRPAKRMRAAAARAAAACGWVQPCRAGTRRRRGSRLACSTARNSIDRATVTDGGWGAPDVGRRWSLEELGKLYILIASLQFSPGTSMRENLFCGCLLALVVAGSSRRNGIHA